MAVEHVLVFGAGYDIPARLRAVGRATGRAVTTSVLCWPQHLARLTDTGHNARVLVLRPETPLTEWIALARAVHDLEPVTRVGSFSDDCRAEVAVVAEALGLHTYPPALVATVADKHAMRRRLAAAGLEQTPSAVVSGGAGVRAFAAEHGYPCVVKPVAGEASAGVVVVRAPAGADEAYTRAGEGGPVLAETHLDGPQYSVEAFSEHGKHVVVAITRKYSDPGSLVELGHVLPAPLDTWTERAITAHTTAVLDALGVEFGPTHTELAVTPAGPRVIETHLRTGGDELWAMATDATGVDLVDAQLRQVLGEDVLPAIRATLRDPGRARRYEAIWFAGAPQAGTLVEVTGVDAARAWADSLEVSGKPGTRLHGLRFSGSRLAHARAHGDTADEALTAARAAIGQLGLVVRHPASQAETI